MIYAFLAISIVFEVIGTSLLKTTSNFTKPLPTLCLLVCYSIAFYLMTYVMKEIPVGMVYAIWSGVGIVLVSAVAYFAHNQDLDLPALAGIGLIVSGVVVINLFSKSVAH